ncbi:MAG: hypothetical protein PVF87_02900 [Acidimicrobiia bacterium]|jgi:hypothetical protein
MPIRSHLGRPLDIRLRSNLILIAIVLITGAVAIALWVAGKPAELIFFAPAQAFVIWALMREIDPDHDWSALVAGAAAGAWVLTGGPYISVLAIGALMLAARLVTESTGRRPLAIDLVAMALAAVIAFTVTGWVAAFGLAIALYLDDRFAPESRRLQIGISALTAVGATVVASLTGAFPHTLPGLSPYVAVTSGLLALLLVAREPVAPISQVDARHKAFVSEERLHASRSLVGILVFGMSLLIGRDAEGLVPVLAALGLAVIANEVERIRRRRG